MAVQKVYIVGAGVMGTGIAETVASTGTEVVLIDNSESLAKKGLQRIGDSIDREIDRWGLTKSEKKAILARITPSADLKILKDAELVIEAVPDRLPVKRELFGQIDKICPPETVLVTNTSTLSISAIASTTARPEKVIGMHFLNSWGVVRSNSAGYVQEMFVESHS